MLLCDVGNSTVSFYENGKSWSVGINKKNIFPKDKKFYYISVNDAITKQLKEYKNALNLEPYFNLDTIYVGLGIDRVAACSAIEDGMIVDAGSAITVDIMSNGIHLGGYIVPGLAAYEKSFASISPKLKKRINPNIDIDTLPQNSVDAISYGVIKPLILSFKDSSKNKRIYFTGGDGKFFSKFFENSIYDKDLVFRGMLKVIKGN